MSSSICPSCNAIHLSVNAGTITGCMHQPPDVPPAELTENHKTWIQQVRACGYYVAIPANEDKEMTEQLVVGEWHEWYGGEMPVPKGTLVEVAHRDGDYFTCHAGEDYAEDWSHDSECPEDGDIMAYRVVNNETA